MTGVESVHIKPDDWQASDLAVAAAREALDESPGAVDLVLFASASQDLVEPATSHIVAAKLGIDAPGHGRQERLQLGAERDRRWATR